MSAWSWRALGLWLAQAGLVGLFGAVLVFGPQIEDGAWDRGIHVTPAQAASHAALISSGFTHHHHGHLPAATTANHPPEDHAALQTAGAGLTWGAPLMQALQPELPFAVPALSALPRRIEQPRPASADTGGFDPPPRV